MATNIALDDRLIEPEIYLLTWRLTRVELTPEY